MSTESSEELRFVFEFEEEKHTEPTTVVAPKAAPERQVEPSTSTADLRARVDRVRSVATMKLAPEPTPSGLDDGLRDDEVESLSIAEFYERLRRAIAAEFSTDIWVTAEIRGLRESRGHHYLELADHGAPTVGRSAAQQLEVVCWARDWPAIEAELSEVGLSLEVGQVVRVCGRVSVWEGGSKVRFTLTALDVEALLGQIAQARRLLLATLEKEGLLDANAKLPVPRVPLRIGLVTSAGSEAHHDFIGQLERSGFAFEVRLESSFVQGAVAPTQLAAAIGRLYAFAPDICVIVRGGGGRGDLAAFDSEMVARAVATAPFPIWTGIGHTNDRSVVDELAQHSCITPTACGEAIVAQVASYWQEITTSARRLSALTIGRLGTARDKLVSAKRVIGRAGRRQLERRAENLAGSRALLVRRVDERLSAERFALDARSVGLNSGVDRAVATSRQVLDRYERLLRAFDPERQLARGWSLMSDESGRLIRRASMATPGTRVATRFVDGTVHSVVDDQQRDARRDDVAIARHGNAEAQ